MKATLEFELAPQHPERDETSQFLKASHATQLVWLIQRILEQARPEEQSWIQNEIATLGIQHLFPEM